MLNGGVTAARTNLAVGLMALAASLGSLAPARVVRAQTVVGPSFQVVVSVSSRAAARLANPRETVVVDVEFYGVPISVKLRMADEGRLDLAVIAVVACSSKALKVRRSAWMPAPPPESEPAIVSTVRGCTCTTLLTGADSLVRWMRGRSLYRWFT